MAPATGHAETLEKSLKDLNLTNDEMTKFEKAFKDPEFLKLFEEYAKEVSDPKTKAETDMYLRQLEQQGRGEDVYGKGVQLVVPSPALVLKTKVMRSQPRHPPPAAAPAAGAGGDEAGLPVGQKVFINICTSDKVDRYKLTEARDPATGRAGKHLSIPLTLGPKRVGIDKQGKPAAVYDFVVHPDSVSFAASNQAAMNSLAETALEQVEGVSRSRLCRSWRRLNLRYKATEGNTEPPVQCIRTSSEAGESVGGRLKPRAHVPGVDVGTAAATKPAPAPAATASGGAGADGAGASMAAVGAGGGEGGRAKGEGGKRSTFSFDRARAAGGKAAGEVAPDIKDPALPGFRHPDGALTPVWSLVYRGEADLAAAWGDAGRGLELAPHHVPKELVVRVTLPEVISAAGVDLDVGERRLDLQVPGRYQLSVPLPYNVDEAKGKAKFDKARKQLEITLPVIPPPPPPRQQAAAAAPPPPPGASPDAAPARQAAQAAGPQHRGDGEHDADSEGPSPPPARTTEAAAAAPPAATAAPESEGARGGGGSRDSGAEGPGVVAGGGASERAEEEESGSSGTVGTADGAATAPTTAPTAAATAAEGSDRPLTENERRWQELHARRHTAASPPAAGPPPHGGQEGGADAAGAGAEGPETGAGAAYQASAEGSAAGAAGATPAEGPALAPAAAAPAAVAPAPEPTVVLRPRLRNELAMELD